MPNDILMPVAVFFPMVSALLVYLIGRGSKTARAVAADIAAAAEFGLLCLLLCGVIAGEEMKAALPGVLSGLRLEADGFRALYALIAGFMWMMTTVFSRQYLAHYHHRGRYYFFTLLTFGATVGVFLSAELLTTFVFFEIMSFTSYVMVIHDENEKAMRAGQTYLAVAILGGMVMLMGLFLLYRLTGTLVIGELREACAAVNASDRPTLYLAGALILFGFGAKAGMYPLHIWLPKAHPVAPAPASALLSGILTKAGIFGVLVLSCRVFLHDAPWGSAILLLGVLTMFTGAAIAVFSVNLKRTLACSSVSQIGFILVGVGLQCLLGEENALAVWGTELHMVNHSLIKLTLFMCAGVVYMDLHKLELNDIRGFGRKKPFLTAIFLCGYLGIAGIPLFNGYISKTLLHEGIVEYAGVLAAAGKNTLPIKAVEWIFLFSGGLTVAYMTKLFVAVFAEKNADAKEQARFDAMRGKYMNRVSALALGLSALVLPALGLLPSILMKGIAELGQGFMNGASPEHAIEWFSLENLKGAAISVAIGAAVYFGLIRTLLMKKDERGVRVYIPVNAAFIDIEDRIYRPLCALLAKLAVCIGSVFAWLGDKGFPAAATKLAVCIGSVFAWLGDKGFPAAAKFITLLIGRIAAAASDGFVSLLRRTVLKPIPIPKRDPKQYEEDDLTVRDRLPKQGEEVLHSFSYGLILFGLGLCAVLIFLLEHNF